MAKALNAIQVELWLVVTPTKRSCSSCSSKAAYRTISLIGSDLYSIVLLFTVFISDTASHAAVLFLAPWLLLLRLSVMHYIYTDHWFWLNHYWIMTWRNCRTFSDSGNSSYLRHAGPSAHFLRQVVPNCFMNTGTFASAHWFMILSYKLFQLSVTIISSIIPGFTAQNHPVQIDIAVCSPPGNIANKSTSPIIGSMLATWCQADPVRYFSRQCTSAFYWNTNPHVIR